MTTIKDVNIQDEAVLVELHIGKFGIVVKDDARTRKVCDDAKADHAAAEVKKKLVDGTFFTPIQRAEAEARNFHYEHTLPWDNECRLLPIATFEEYMKGMKNCKRRFEETAGAFMVNWEAMKEAAKTMLGEMYNEADYPDKEIVRGKFYLDHGIMPVPSAEDMRRRVPLVNALGVNADNVSEAIEEKVKERIEQAQTDLLQRMMAPVRHIIEVLKRDKPRIFDTLVEDVRDVANTVRSLNITRDPQLNQWATELEEKLAKMKPDELRDSKKSRQQVLDDAMDIFKRMEAYAEQ